MRRLIIAGLILAGITAYAAIAARFPFAQALALIGSAQPLALTLYVCASLAIMLTFAWRWRVIERAEGVDIGLARLFVYRVAGYGVSFLTPGPKVGGEFVRAELVRRHARTPYRVALGHVIHDKAIEYTTLLLFFIIGITLLLATSPLPSTARAWLTLLVIAATALAVYIIGRLLRGKRITTPLFRLAGLRRLKRVHDEIRQIEEQIIAFRRRSPKAFIAAVMISAASWALSISEYHLLLLALGYEPTFFTSLLAFVGVGLAYSIPVPLALGTLEAVQIGIFSAVGLPPAGAIALSQITRLRDLGWSGLALIIISCSGIDWGRLRRIARRSHA